MFDPYGAVGLMYEMGLGTIKDYAKAIENYEEIPDRSDDRIYFLKAAEQGRLAYVKELKKEQNRAMLMP